MFLGAASVLGSCWGWVEGRGPRAAHCLATPAAHLGHPASRAARAWWRCGAR